MFDLPPCDLTSESSSLVSLFPPCLRSLTTSLMVLLGRRVSKARTPSSASSVGTETICPPSPGVPSTRNCESHSRTSIAGWRLAGIRGKEHVVVSAGVRARRRRTLGRRITVNLLTMYVSHWYRRVLDILKLLMPSPTEI